MSRSLHSAGLRKKDIAYNTFSYHLGPAGLMFHQACNDLGCAVIPGGIGNTDLQLETIKNLNPSFYIGTPSFLKILLEKAKENKIDISCFLGIFWGRTRVRVVPTRKVFVDMLGLHK